MEDKLWAIVGLVIASQGVWELILYLIKRRHAKEDTHSSEYDNLKDAVLSLQHDRLYQIYRFHAKEENKTISIEELENVDYLYESYEKLGGNGTGTLLYHRMRNELEVVNTNEDKF